jgi:hypothetical protein
MAKKRKLTVGGRAAAQRQIQQMVKDTKAGRGALAYVPKRTTPKVVVRRGFAR